MLISIIMPVYNNEKYFPLAVKSVLNQDYTDFELIIIDDGSTDRTSVIADKFAEQDKRVRVIHQTNQWIYASFNRGIEEAKGEYIYILNSDDRLRENSLKMMANRVIKYRPDVIWTLVLMHECDEEQNILKYNKNQLDKLVEKEVFYQTEREIHENWPYFYISSLAQNQANLYRSEIMKKHKFRNDVYGADTLFNIDIAPDIQSALVMKDPVYDFFVYKQNENAINASVGKYYAYEHDMFNEIYAQYMKLFVKWRIPEEKYKTILASRRLRQVTIEIYSTFAENCAMAIDRKIKYILCEIPDSLVVECAKATHREEELESRILSGLRELFIRESLSKRSEMYFIYEFLESLLRYEKDQKDFDKIKYAIDHPYNPVHIGQSFYRQLKRNN